MIGPRIHIPEQKHIIIRQEQARVLLIVDGKTILDMPWDATLEIAGYLYLQAKKAEEFAQATRIINDQAILTRAGFPIGLSNNPHILKEAAKEAAWNSRLRRYIPPGVRSGEIVGTPTIINHKEQNNGKERT